MYPIPLMKNRSYHIKRSQCPKGITKQVYKLNLGVGRVVIHVLVVCEILGIKLQISMHRQQTTC